MKHGLQSVGWLFILSITGF